MISNILKSFDKEGAIYMGAKRESNGCKVAIFGVPYDGTTSFRPGARFGPASIREVSSSLETYCPQLDLDLEDLNYTDLGSLSIQSGAPEPIIDAVNNSTEKILRSGLKPLMLGGEHSITSGAVAAITTLYKDLILVQLDAHADLREEWNGNRNSHACSMRRCLEVLPSKKLFQLGIRSGTKQEFEEIRKEKRLLVQNSGDQASTLKKALEPHLNTPIYLTVDLDWFDPSVLPGTGTPEPGGFKWCDFASVIDVLKQHKVVGADIVELSPQLDISNSSSILAAKVTRSLIMLLSL